MINSRLFVFSCLLALVVSISAIDAWCAPEPTQQVNVNAPQGLLNRSNAKAKQSSESAKKAEPRETEKKVENKSESKNSTASNKESSTTKKDVNNKPGKQKPLGTAYGYRVQVYANSNAGTAKETAKTRAREIARKFPNYKAYISFSTPSWRLRIGDFKDQDDAKEALVKLKRSFPSYAASMMVVRDHINIWSHD